MPSCNGQHCSLHSSSCDAYLDDYELVNQKSYSLCLLNLIGKNDNEGERGANGKVQRQGLCVHCKVLNKIVNDNNEITLIIVGLNLQAVYDNHVCVFS